jgi:hypothetical protein
MVTNEKHLHRVRLSQDANVTVLSPGGMGSTYILDTLQAFPDIRARKRHPITEEVLFKPKTQKIVYVYNDPLLALISRFRRNLLFSGWALNQRSNSLHLEKSAMTEEIKNEFLLYGAFLRKTQEEANTIGRLPRKYEMHFAEKLFSYIEKTKKDLYGIADHFQEAYSLRKDLDILFLDIRNPNASEKLSKFFKRQIVVFQRDRKSKLNHIERFLVKKDIIYALYNKIDERITKIVNK